jgi:hypothetical protein
MAVPASEILYGFAAVDIQGGLNGGGGEGEAMDVNLDGYISAIDALLVINNLNLHGSRALGEGESGGDIPLHRLDVNRDSVISAIDALLVINHLNGAAGLGEGEGESGLVTEIRPNLDRDADILLTNQESESILEEEQLLNPATRSPSDATTDWRLIIGEESRPESSAIDAGEVNDEAWEALLRDLAEDALDALLDPEDR